MVNGAAPRVYRAKQMTVKPENSRPRLETGMHSTQSARPKSQTTGAAEMNTKLKVAVADDDRDVREVLEKMLSALGHEVAIQASTGRELVDQCLAHGADLVMTDIQMPDMDGLDAAGAIYRNSPTPIILLSGHCDRELIERAEENHVFAYLLKPITQAQLEPAIALAMRRYEEFQALKHEADDLRQALADRKLIERAKGLLMKHLNLDEQDAFRRLQKLASSKNKKLIEIAEMVLTMAEALNG
jgi:response regulator NasT